MYKKGFMRTLEAIVAILIIFGFILFIFPKAERFEGYMPVELDRLSTSLVSEIQNQDAFRKSVLTPNNMIEYHGDNQNNVHQLEGYKIINNFISDSLPKFSPWNYAFSISTVGNNNGFIAYYPTFDLNNPLIDEDLFKTQLSQIDKSIYTKSLFVSVDDVTALPLEQAPIQQQQEYKEFKIYFWSK